MLLLILWIGISAHTQRSKWKTHSDEAMSLYRQGHYDQAVEMAKKALQVAEQTEGPNHPSVAAPLNNLATMFSTQGQYVQAEPLYNRSLAINEQALGPDHPNVAQDLEDLAALYRKSGREKEAEAPEKRAAAIRAIGIAFTSCAAWQKLQPSRTFCMAANSDQKT